MGFQLEAFVYFSSLIITTVTILAISWAARRELLPDRLSPWTIGILLIGAGGFLLACFKISTPPDRFHDFLSAYYPAGSAAVHQQYSALRILTDKGVSGFVNMPIIAYLFAPFGFLNPNIAAALFTALGIALTVASWILLLRLTRPERRERWLLAVLFLANGPLINGIKLGNTSYFILFCMVASLILLRANRSISAGAIMAAAAMLKPPLLLFGVFFAARRDFAGTFGFAAICVLTALLSLVVFGWADNLHWFQVSILEYTRGWLSAFNVQSIPGFLLRLHPETQLADWQAHLPSAGEKLASRILTALIFFVAAAIAVSSVKSSHQHHGDISARRELQFLLVICLCLVCSPLTWSHYYVWLLIPIAFFLGTQPSLPSSKFEQVIVWIAIACVTPVVVWPWSIPNRLLMAAYRSFGISHLLFGGLLWVGLICWWLVRPRLRPSTREADRPQPDPS